MNVVLLSSFIICSSSFLFPDCNNNGIDDAVDIASCNGDAACEDCNLDGRPDECGVSIDCDTHETQRFTASDAAPHDDFGGAISASGDVVIVGAAKDDCVDGEDCGAAYIFRFDGASWVEEQRLTASDASAADDFGISVSLSGNVAVVGARFKGCGASIKCGASYVFRFNGSSWVEEQELTAFDAAQFDGFGNSVDVSGDVIIVGAPGSRTGPGNLFGAIYIFRFNGSTWVQEQRMVSPGSQLLVLTQA